MFKFLMSLVAAVASFVGFWGTTNTALAQPVIGSTEPLVNSSVNVSLKQPINLNTTASLWQLNDANAKNIFEHLGCSCAACAETVQVDSL